MSWPAVILNLAKIDMKGKKKTEAQIKLDRRTVLEGFTLYGQGYPRGFSRNQRGR